MKAARVTPRISSTNYRPISILPIFSKILVKIVNSQLRLHLTVNNVICQKKFGFQKRKGTGNALMDFLKRSFRALSKSHTILGVFLDFSKAFDTVDHETLIYKL